MPRFLKETPWLHRVLNCPAPWTIVCSEDSTVFLQYKCYITIYDMDPNICIVLVPLFVLICLVESCTKRQLGAKFRLYVFSVLPHIDAMDL